MAEIIKNIQASGGDYTNLQAWEDDIPASLTSGNQYIGKLADEHFSISGQALSISGQTGESATTYIELTTQASASRLDDDTNSLEFDSTSGAAITGTPSYSTCILIATAYTRINKIQVKETASNSSGIEITAANCTIRNNILSVKSGRANEGGIFSNVSTDIINNLVFYNGPPNSNTLAISAANATSNVIGNTAISPSDYSAAGKGIFVNYARPDVFGNAVFGFSTDYAKNGGSAWSAGTDYNASSDATAPGTNSTASVTYSGTAPFVDADSATALDFKLKTGSALEAISGQHALTNDLDIFGNTRNTSTPDCGCHELQAAGGATSELSSGNFALLGSALDTLYHQKSQLSTGSFTLTTTNIDTFYARVSQLSTGSLLLTGSAISTFYNRRIQIASGVYLVSGSAIGTSSENKISINAGSFALTGSTIDTLFHRISALTAGSFALTGSTITTSVELQEFITVLTQGIFTLSASDITTTDNHRLTVDVNEINELIPLAVEPHNQNQVLEEIVIALKTIITEINRNLEIAEANIISLTTGSTWLPLTLLLGWVNIGSGIQEAEYRKIGNEVQVRGLIKSGIDGISFILPAGFRPATTQILDFFNGSHIGQAQVSTNGEVYLSNTSTFTNSLHGITFSTL